MSLTPQWLDELRARVSLSGVIARTTRLTKAGREFKACCPFHSEKSPSFYVNDEKGFYHCFGCGVHGDVIRWMTDQRGLAFMDAVRELAGEAGMELPAMDPKAAEKAERAATLGDVTAAAQAWFVEQLRGSGGAAARRYLDGRGFPTPVIERFGFGFAPEGRQALREGLRQFSDELLIEAGLRIVVEGKDPYDRFRNRLILPIRNPRGGIVGFGGRILDGSAPDAPKYLNSPDTSLFDKGRTLYNLDKAGPPARKSGRMVVVEGYMDVVALAAAGIEEVVAPLGTALTEAQIELLWRVVESPVLCFDGDAAGQRASIRAATRALPILRPSHSLSFVHLPDGYDPDDLVRKEGAEGLLKALALNASLNEVLWQHERNASRVETPEEKAGLKARLIAHADSIQHPDIKSLYRSEFLKRFSEFAFPARDWSAYKNVSDIASFRNGLTDKKRFGATQMRGARPALVTQFPGKASESLTAKHRDPVARDRHLHRRLGAAITAGLMYFPAYSLVYAETLYQSRDLDPRLEAIADATFQFDVLEPSQVVTILEKQGLHPPTPDEWDRLRFPFAWPPLDNGSAVEGLELAIQLYVGLPQVKKALDDATHRLASDFSEANWQEQQRLLKVKDGFLKVPDELKIAPDELTALAA